MKKQLEPRCQNEVNRLINVTILIGLVSKYLIRKCEENCLVSILRVDCHK